MDEDKYLIVCGMQRSGTRQFADFLNCHKKICLQGEINSALIPYIYELLKKADSRLLQTKYHDEYIKKRRHTTLDLFSLILKSNKKTKNNKTYQGFKTPNVEFQYDKLCFIFHPIFKILHFYYCIRNIKDCYLSLSSMPWFKKTPKEYISKYINSLKAAITISKINEIGGSKTSITVLSLDEYIQTEKKAEWLVDKLFKSINIQLSIDQAKKFIAKTENRNSTIRTTGKKRETELSNDVEKVFLKYDNEINLAINEFNLVFKSRLPFL